MKRIELEDRDSWLKRRSEIQGIGASEAALVCGIKGAFGNIDELYSVKRKIHENKTISNERIEAGILAEPLIRDLFAIENKDRFKVEYRGFDILISDEHPFMFCTLDGELTDITNDERGVLEIKKVEINKKAELEEWNNRIPERYLCQQIHQLEVTQWDFDLLVACLSIAQWKKTDNGYEKLPYRRTEFRYSYIRRDDPDYPSQAEFVVGKEEKFWSNLQKGVRPGVKVL